RNNTLFMKADKQSYNNPIRYTKNPLLSGYISKPNLDSLSLTVPFKSNADMILFQSGIANLFLMRQRYINKGEFFIILRIKK
ncbi:MAG: hypothetical protein QMB59_00875, partial [Bacteroidales bacterium]